ncbi:ABC transporter permease [Methylicorpusculum oleiharenae]|uniref:ABC transporter permease n=1 Tax=Methylicorpusculum oleiharenae TaxID=1338687 RepID=UPI001358101C|nr:ABC transporter permease [Methylicorpusculum oleiharenae]MCD2449892.1 ABC transporter permease [Methylicorpusculum oleiharenae]
MNINPEFQRQLYLECSHARLIGIPLILGAVFTFSYFADNHRLASGSAQAAMTLFLIITLLWGVRQTMDSVVEEYRDRTWDTQRLSALSPWQMTWGKWLGSTIMVWYAGLICLLVYLIASEPGQPLFWPCFYATGGALLVQGLSLLLGQISVRQGHTKTGSTLLIVLLGVFIIAPWNRFASFGYFQQTAAVTWYHLRIIQQDFELISLLLALFWCSVGNYRLMSQELGIRTTPWCWLAFAVFLIVYLGGFLPGTSYPFSLMAFMVCISLGYIGVVIERNEAIRIKRLLTYLQQHNWRRSAEELPVWCVSLLLATPFALLLSLSEHPMRNLGNSFHFYPLPVLLLLLRDVALYLFFSYGKNPQRALSLTLLWGVLLYGILPGMFTLAGQNWLAALFFPLWADSASGALVCALLQTALLSALLYRRWQENV